MTTALQGTDLIREYDRMRRDIELHDPRELEGEGESIVLSKITARTIRKTQF